jgi:hypothetical protein
MGSTLGEMGGTSGGVYSLLLTAASSVQFSRGKESPCGVVAEAFRRGVEAVMEYGGARQGDRTMVTPFNISYCCAVFGPVAVGRDVAGIGSLRGK